MSKKDEYRAKLQALSDWDNYLLKESGLPGPRGNIELAQIAADEGNLELFLRYIGYTADRAPANSPYEFLAFCGTVGLGRLLAEGGMKQLKILRALASDPRWRIREAVAMALQRLGDVNWNQLLTAMRNWSHGTPLEQRAAACALCEPRLLGQEEHARDTLDILDRITASIEQIVDRRIEDFSSLRKGMAYCWSVAVASLPDEGKNIMEKWLISTDKDITWIMQQNLKKKRLDRMDGSWVQKWMDRIGS